MKKLLSLVMAFLLIATTIGTVPIVFAEEVEYTLVTKNYAQMYWEEFYEDDDPKYDIGIVRVNNWYYKYSKNK